jgi:hypothetical protein
MATAQGHLDKARNNRQSTRPRGTTETTAEPAATATDLTDDLFPQQEPTKTNAVFVAIGLADTHNNIIYTELTGAFPIKSLSDNRYMLILYHYGSNAILVQPMKNRSDAEVLRAYGALYENLTACGLKLSLNILDNEASKALKKAITKTGATYQLVEPGNHRVNAAEWAIRTFKNHFVAGLCSTYPQFPVSLWDQLIPQAVLTLNLLRTSCSNPQLSAHAQLYGMFDFNKTPLAPPGTRALVYEDPGNRASWAPHGKEAWYLGPAPEHYRCCRFHIPETKGTRISGTAEFFSHHCKLPAVSSANAAKHAAQELIHALQNPAPCLPFQRLAPRHLTAIRQLAKIFQRTTTPSPPETSSPVTLPRVAPATLPRVAPAPLPRVNASPISVAPTAAAKRFEPRPATHRYPTRNQEPRYPTRERHNHSA